MSSILLTILPVFGLIALGYAAARTGFMGPEVARGVGQFVFAMAIPALLFRTVATMAPEAAAPWPLWLALFGGIAVVWLLTSLIARRIDAFADGGAAAAMGAGFGNLALLGLPLSIAHFGPEAAVPVSLILSIHAPVLWLAAVVQMEFARQGKAPSPLGLLRQLAIELARNPMVIALIAGSLWRAGGLSLHPVADRLLDLLGNAGVPAALVALGLSLATYSLKGQWGAIALLIAMKMLLLPVVVWALARYAVAMPPLWVQIAVLMAVMPTGANAYLFAQRYDTGTAAVSGAIALGTALALLAAAAVLALIDRGMI